MLKNFVAGNALLLAIVLTGCADNPADHQPKATVTEAKGTPAPESPPAPAPEATAPVSANPVPAGAMAPPAAASGARAFAFSPESKIEWTGSKVTGHHDGGFKSFTGEIHLVNNDPAASSVNVKIDVNTIYTNSDQLINHLKSPDFFDAAQFPQATFASTGIVKNGDQYTVSGDLSMHGVTKNISFPATIQVTDNQVAADSEFAIQRTDFGIKYPGKANDLIRDGVVVKLHIVATPKQ